MTLTTHLIIWSIAMLLPVTTASALILIHWVKVDIKDFSQYQGFVMSRGLIASLILMVLFIVCFFLTARPF